MSASEPITLSRACEVIEIPSGIRGILPGGAVVRIMQSLGSGYTVTTDRGYMYRVDAKDTDALGISNPTAQIPGVKEVHVEVVFDPQWHPGLMSDAAKLQLGFDLDYGVTQTSPPIHGGR